MFWRKAVALRTLGYLELAKRAAFAGLDAEPSNKTLASELLLIEADIQRYKKSDQQQTTKSSSGLLIQKVQVVEKFPDSILTETERKLNQVAVVPVPPDLSVPSSPINSVAYSSSTPKKIPFTPPGLPLTMLGLTQLLRIPKYQLQDAYAFFFENVEPQSLPSMLGKAGVEPEFIDFFLDAAIEAHNASPQWSRRTILFLDSLASCPRFSIALMFSSSTKLSSLKKLLLSQPLESLDASILAKWK